MSWQFYNLDREAQKLVLKYRDKDEVLNESHKMRLAVTYGLERFWGEHLRLIGNNKDATDKVKGEYWQKTWETFVEIMDEAGVKIPKGEVKHGDTKAIEKMAKELWDLPIETQRISLVILAQLCDSLVWWTQRYKKKPSKKNEAVENE